MNIFFLNIILEVVEGRLIAQNIPTFGKTY